MSVKKKPANTASNTDVAAGTPETGVTDVTGVRPAVTSVTSVTSVPVQRILEQHTVELILEADQPIKHLAETFGNHGVLNTRRIRQREGGYAAVPEVSGDAMRHGLREAGARFSLAARKDQTRGLTEAALRLLFAGGMVTGNGDAQTVKLGEYREMVDVMPHLALLGGCAMNRTIPGRMRVSPATLICAESARFLPPWIAEACESLGRPHLESAREAIEVDQRVRMEPMLDPAKRLLLAPEEAERIERRLTAGERASEAGDDAGRKATKMTMMPRSFERIAQGSLFSWSINVDLYSDLDMDTFYTLLCAFVASMRVGGGGATGHGRMRVVAARRTVISSATELPAEANVELVAMRQNIGARYFAHIRERAEQLDAFLRRVDA